MTTSTAAMATHAITTVATSHRLRRSTQQRYANIKIQGSMYIDCIHYSHLLLRPNLILITLHSIYAIARICHANSVCPSVHLSVCHTHVLYCIKTAESIIQILSRSDRPIILVFRHQGSLRNSEGVTPNGGAKYKGVAIFDQYAAISRKR